MNSRLTARQMIHLHQNPIKSVLNQKKNKGLIPDNTEDETNNVRKSLETIKDILSAERVERRHNRSEAIWLADRKLAKITRRIGNIYPQFGFMENNDIFLSPNEALFLLQTNRLELLWNGVPFSLEEAYTVLLDSKDSLAKYRTFQELAAKGYLIQKPNKSSKRKLENTEIINNKKIKIDDKNEGSDIFEKLKLNGPSTASNIESNSSSLYNLYLPCPSIKDKIPDHSVIIKPEENQFSLHCVSENESSLLTSFTGNESVSFYQFHKVDLDNT